MMPSKQSLDHETWNLATGLNDTGPRNSVDVVVKE